MIEENTNIPEKNGNLPFNLSSHPYNNLNIDFRFEAYCIGREKGQDPINEDLSLTYLAKLFDEIRKKYWGVKEFYVFVCGFLKSCDSRVDKEKINTIMKELDCYTPENEKVKNLTILEKYYRYLNL